jgi:hypothetical protein
VAIVSLGATAGVLAASPSKGAHFTGKLPGKVGKFGRKLSFTVSKNGTKVTAFTYDFGFCGGVGGPPPTKSPFPHIRFKAMTISATGTFAGHASKRVTQGVPYTETYDITGKFTKSKQATGTATLADRFATPRANCGPVTEGWSASAK